MSKSRLREVRIFRSNVEWRVEVTFKDGTHADQALADNDLLQVQVAGSTLKPVVGIMEVPRENSYRSVALLVDGISDEYALDRECAS